MVRQHLRHHLAQRARLLGSRAGLSKRKESHHAKQSQREEGRERERGRETERQTERASERASERNPHTLTHPHTHRDDKCMRTYIHTYIYIYVQINANRITDVFSTMVVHAEERQRSPALCLAMRFQPRIDDILEGVDVGVFWSPKPRQSHASLYRSHG